MTAPTPFLNGHKDFFLRLLSPPAPREETWLGTAGRGHLNLARIKERRPADCQAGARELDEMQRQVTDLMRNQRTGTNPAARKRPIRMDMR